MNRDLLDDNNIPEFSIQATKFKLFNKEVFALLENTQIEPFQKFMDRINKFENFDDCKLDLFKDLVSKRYPDFNNLHSMENQNFLKNFLGSYFFDMFEKIEEEYKIQIREYKIDQINVNK